MKKTCWNCAHHHDTLAEPGENNFWHIHDYCDAWDKSSMCSMHSRLCEFLDAELHEVIDDVMTKYGFNDSYFIDDDFEIGQAGCYRFKDNEEPSKDEEMKKNFEHNKDLALKVVNVILDKIERGDTYDIDERQYYMQCKEEIENMKFED